MDAIIEYIRKTYRPLALIVYGSFADGTNGAHSDFDALAIVPEGEPIHDDTVQSGTRLDLFVYPRRTFLQPYDPEAFFQVWDGRILFDTEDLAHRLKETVKAYIEALPVPTAEENRQNVAWCRKMLERSESGDAEGRYRLYWLLKDTLEIYFDLRHAHYFGPKKALGQMRRDDADAAEIYTRALMEPTGEHVRDWVELLEHMAEGQ